MHDAIMIYSFDIDFSSVFSMIALLLSKNSRASCFLSFVHRNSYRSLFHHLHSWGLKGSILSTFSSIEPTDICIETENRDQIEEEKISLAHHRFEDGFYRINSSPSSLSDYTVKEGQTIIKEGKVYQDKTDFSWDAYSILQIELISSLSSG